MNDRDSTSTVERMVTALTACADALTAASAIVKTPRLAARLVQLAENRTRAASALTQTIGVEFVANAGTDRPVPSAIVALHAGIIAPYLAPSALLLPCVRVLDSSMTELRRSFGPTMSLEQRVTLERHLGLLRWMREDLEVLRRTRKPSAAERQERGEHLMEQSAAH